jgi:thioredoxin-like negative regulator of GroEL
MGWLTQLLGLESAGAADVRNVTDANYKQEVLQSELPVLLDVWSDGCGPCKMLEPVVMELSRQFKGRLKVAEINAATAPKTMQKLGVSGTPTVLYFRKGRVVERVVGYRALHYHRAFVEQELLPAVGPDQRAP